MFFILEDLPGLIKIILVIVIFITNIWFFTLWLHLFFRDSRFAVFRFLALFLGKISFLGKDYWKKEIVQSLKTDKGLTFLFGKDGKDDVKLAKVEEEAKDGSDIIGESSDKNSKDGKTKDQTSKDGKEEPEKKRKKKKKKTKKPEGEEP